MRVLLIRDRSPAAPIWEQVLRTRGHDVVVENDHAAVLKLASDELFEMIVVDLIDRDDDRLALCRNLREVPGGAWSVLLAVINSNQPNVVQGALGAGADDYLFSEDPASVCDIRLAIAEHRVEEKRSREAMLVELNCAEHRFQEMLETAPDAIIGCEPDGRISFVNNQAARMTGYDRSELLGRLIELLVPERFATSHVEQRRRFFEHPTTRPMGVARNLTMRCKNGRTIDVDICLGYHQDQSRTTAVAAVRDVTERRRLEEELRLAKVATERAYERIRSEVEAAARIQQALLPTSLPTSEVVRFAYEYHPCEDLGGDALGVFRLDEDQIAFHLLDVSGHGAAAALLSVALTRQISSSLGVSGLLLGGDSTAKFDRLSPADVVRSLNEWFLSHPTAEQYFTLIFGVLNLKTLLFRYASAGHPSMLLVRRQSPNETLASTGIPVGFDIDAVYENAEVVLRPGDRLLLYSDGVTEALGESGAMYGVERLQRRWQASVDSTLAESLQRIREVVLGWAGGRPDDDVTLLAVEIRDGGA